jgi:hypothetical protein
MPTVSDPDLVPFDPPDHPTFRAAFRNIIESYPHALYDDQGMVRYRTRFLDSVLVRRRIQRSIYEEARDVARLLAKTEAFERSRHDRKRVEMLFAHLKRIFRLGRLRLRGPSGAQFEFTMAAIAQNLRRLAKLVVRPPPVTERCFA